MLQTGRLKIHISIHALREEGDRPRWQPGGLRQAFLSTPSARRATELDGFTEYTESISIHALREEGDAVGARRLTDKQNFYPRPPRGGRLAAQSNGGAEPLFLSTPSARRATCPREREVRVLHISIHALREEGDSRQILKRSDLQHFYPRPPRGGRHFA